MASALTRSTYLDLLSMARRHSSGSIEADDLLHDALTVALRAGREISPDNRAWLWGVMRNLAAMQRRGTARRIRREQHLHAAVPEASTPHFVEKAELAGLPPALRIVALLVLSGHNRLEVRSLLRLSDDALRQRIAGLRRAFAHDRNGGFADFYSLRGVLEFGSIRRSLLPMMRAAKADLATHDPDGHLLAFRISSPVAHKTDAGGN